MLLLAKTGENAVMDLNDSNSRIVNGLRMANEPDETGALIAEILPESILSIPKDPEERERVFDTAIENLLTMTKETGASLKIMLANLDRKKSTQNPQLS